MSATRFVTSRGTVALVETNHAIPIVDVTVVVRSGSLVDPDGKEGLARIAARLVRMGTTTRTSEQLDETIEGLGASLSVDVSHGTMRFFGSVISRNFGPFLTIVGELLSAPGLRAKDLALVRRETLAELVAQRDNDRWLASRAFRSLLFGAHPYARSALGSARSVRAVRREDVLGLVERHFTGANLVVGIAGDVDAATLPGLVERAFGSLPSRAVPEIPLAKPVRARGRRVVVVDKPGRTQTQMFVGTLGSRLRDPDFHSLLVANTAFGGTFTARLVREVRVKRGWSYSAHSRLGADREREAWSLYTHPSSENAVDCLALELGLVERFVRSGVTARELGFAKTYLVKSHAFDLDTPQKRLEPRLDAEIHGLPASFHERFVDHVRAVEPVAANEAVARRLSERDVSIALVATASEIVEPLRAIRGLEVDVVPFDRI
jgi:zinc protease